MDTLTEQEETEKTMSALNLKHRFRHPVFPPQDTCTIFLKVGYQDEN